MEENSKNLSKKNQDSVNKKRERKNNHTKNGKIINDSFDIEFGDGMQRDENNLLDCTSLVEIGFTSCSNCGKKIRALDDMKIKGNFYCTKCKMDIINGESEKDILLMRKNELVRELAEINYRLDQFKTASCL